jgi:hypothetical protein
MMAFDSTVVSIDKSAVIKAVKKYPNPVSGPGMYSYMI